MVYTPKTLCLRRILSTKCTNKKITSHFLKAQTALFFFKTLLRLIKKVPLFFLGTYPSIQKKAVLISQLLQRITFIFSKYPFITRARLTKNVPFYLSRPFFFFRTNVPIFFWEDCFCFSKKYSFDFATLTSLFLKMYLLDFENSSIVYRIKTSFNFLLCSVRWKKTYPLFS